MKIREIYSKLNSRTFFLSPLLFLTSLFIKFELNNKGEGTSPEQEALVHNLLHSGGKFKKLN